MAAAARAQELTGVVGHIPKALQAVAADFYVNVTNTGSLDADDVVLGASTPSVQRPSPCATIHLRVFQEPGSQFMCASRSW